MALRELLVSVDASDTGRERLDFALALAQAHEAVLTAYYSSPTVTGNGEGTPDEIAEAIERNFESTLAARGLTGSWTLSGDPVVGDLVDQIKYVDLAILGLGPPDAGAVDPQGFKIADVVVACGRPVLATPVSRLPARFTRALIAWDGSREASRALHDSLPLLRGVGRVWVASIGRDGHALAGRAVAHLARHGVQAAVDTTPSIEFEIGAELLERAAALDVDLLVAGAYGHSRLGEELFGGASRSLLNQMLVPVLLSH